MTASVQAPAPCTGHPPPTVRPPGAPPLPRALASWCRNHRAARKYQHAESTTRSGARCDLLLRRMTSPWFFPLALLAGLAMALGAGALTRLMAARRRRNRRVVELPNSHYTWERVREQEARDLWRDIPLERIHPVNRDEVTRLLARVEAAGADTLRPQERRFLDQMAQIAGSTPAPPAPARCDAQPVPDITR